MSRDYFQPPVYDLGVIFRILDLLRTVATLIRVRIHPVNQMIVLDITRHLINMWEVGNILKIRTVQVFSKKVLKTIFIVINPE